MRKVKKPFPVALFCSDIHLSDEVPSARAETAFEWRVTQFDYLDQMITLANQNDVSIFIAGDIFHTAEVSNGLVNDVMMILDKTKMPIFAIPGNHDLLHHNYDNIYKSAYGSLVISQKIVEIGIQGRIFLRTKKSKVRVWGFPYGAPLAGVDEKEDGVLDIAMVHKFCWYGKHTAHKKADDDNRADNLAKSLKGFDGAVFGDNHTGFLHERDIDIFNCGCMIPRRMPEQLLTPQVGLLHSDGRIKVIPLDNSKDKWKDKIELPTNLTTSNIDVYSIFEGMETLPAEAKVDYAERVLDMIEQNDIREEVKLIVSKTLNKVRKELA